MRLNNLPAGVRVFGNPKWRGRCVAESVDQISFFSKLRAEYPATFGMLAIHPRNEQLLRGGQFRAVARHKAEGMTPGASDIVIPGRVSFVCELKRRDYTKSKWQDGQIEYLTAAADAGAFACVALGAAAAWEAFDVWRDETK